MKKRTGTPHVVKRTPTDRRFEMAVLDPVIHREKKKVKCGASGLRMRAYLNENKREGNCKAQRTYVHDRCSWIGV